MSEKFYVRMVDKFMSGWGGAKGRRAIYVVECDTLEQAEAVEKAAQDRSEMKYVTLTTTQPRRKANEQMTVRHFFDLGGPWHAYCHWGLKQEIAQHRAAELAREQELYAQQNTPAWA